MAISVADNFSYQGGKPLDARMKYDSVANMVGVPAANLYDGCFAYVTAEQKYYSYDSANDTDPTLGKWREYSGGGSGGGHTIEGDGTAVTDRDTLNFKDMSVSDDSQNEKTDVEPHRLTAEELADIVSPTPLYDFSNPGAEAFIFSTNERVIGQWIDGKPLYQRTYDLGDLPNNDQKNVTIDNFNSISEIVDLRCFAKVKSGVGGFSLPKVNPDVSLYVNTSGFFTVVSTSNYSTNKAYATLRYTKTTDTAVASGEKIVGQWIDGKPLFEKTVDCGALPNTASKKVAHGISNLEMVTMINGCAYNPNTHIYPPMNFAHQDSTNNISCRINNGDVEIIAGTNLTMYTQSYVTLRYTKV